MIAEDQKIELSGVEGILMYKDAFDGNTFYYSSTRPSIGRQNDDFAFTLLRYDQPENDLVGALSFIVDLEPDADELRDAEKQLQKSYPEAHLKPMPWTSGLVTAAIIGGDPVQSTPSLIGRNSTVINIGLSTNQYLVLKKSIENASSPPISIVYKLSYDAYRKAYEYSFEFNQQKFRDWLQQKCTANLLFISFEKVDTFEELKNSGVIKIESINLTETDPPAELKHAFLRSLQNVLVPLPQFAKPPQGEQAAWLIGFDCSSVRDIQNIQRQIDCDIQASGAVTHTIFIQGAVGNLAEAYMARPEVKIPRSGQFTQDIIFRCHATFDDRPLKFVTLFIEGNYQYSLTFDHLNYQDWPLVLTYDRGEDKYFYHCELNFAEQEKGFTTEPVLISRDKPFIDIIPADFYTYRRWAVSVAKDFPWQLMQSIKVTLWTSIPGTAEVPKPLYLDDKKQIGDLEFFASSPVSLETLEFSASYQPKDRDPFQLEGLPAGSTLFLNPFRKKTFRIQADESFDWSRYQSISVIIQLPPGILSDSKLVNRKITEGFKQLAWNLWWSGEPDWKRIKYKTKFEPSQSSATITPVWQTATGNVITIKTPD